MVPSTVEVLTVFPGFLTSPGARERDLGSEVGQTRSDPASSLPPLSILVQTGRSEKGLGCVRVV